MPQPTSILDAFQDAVRTVETAFVGQHIWHKRKCWRRLYIECGSFRLEYTADHGKKREEG